MGCWTIFHTLQETTSYEAKNWLFESEFNRSVKVRTTDERIASDACLLLLREADHRLGLAEHLAAQHVDPQPQDRIRKTLVELLRERLYGMAMGYLPQSGSAGGEAQHSMGFPYPIGYWGS